MQTAKDSTWIDSGQVEKDEERKWLRSDDIDSIDREKREDLMSLTISKGYNNSAPPLRTFLLRSLRSKLQEKWKKCKNNTNAVYL